MTLKENTLNENVEVNFLRNSLKKLSIKNESYQILPQDSTEKSTKTSFFSRRLSPLKGCFFAFLTAVSWSVSNVFIKKASLLNDYDQLTILNLVTVVLMIPIICYNKLNPFGLKGQRVLLSFRGVLSVLGLILIYTALRFIPPSDLSATGHVSILVTALLSRIFLKEKLGIPHIFALVLTIFGVTVIAKPSFLFDSKQENTNSSLNATTGLLDSKHSSGFEFKLGIGLVVIAAFLFGSIQIMIKKLCNSNVHWSISTIYAAYYGLPITIGIEIALYSLKLSNENILNDLNLLLVNILYSTVSAVFGIAGQVFLNVALQYEDATKVAIAKTSDVIFAFILQLIILNIKIDFLSVIGSLAIVFGTFVVLGFKMIETKYAKLTHRKKSTFEKFIFFKF